MDKLVELILNGWPNYRYPRFHIKVPACEGELNFGEALLGNFIPDAAPTDHWLDRYHQMLLHNNSPSFNLAGLASIVYWGFARTRRGLAQGRARTRALWLLHGHGNRQATTHPAAADALKAAREDIAAGRFGDALGRFQGNLSSVALRSRRKSSPFSALNAPGCTTQKSPLPSQLMRHWFDTPSRQHF